MSRRWRIVSFGGAAVLIAGGILGAVFVSGGTGQLLALVLISLGFVLATSLVFLEVGLSEDRELDRQRRRREPRPRRPGPSGLSRMRGSRRRLR